MSWQIPENEKKEGWIQLKKELSVKYSGDIELVFPKGCDDQCFRWFEILEEEDFRYELRYTRAEVLERLNHPGVLFFFIICKEIPEILVLGYEQPSYEPSTFCLDTIAIRQRGRGIGDIVMRFLIDWARGKQYQAMILDTEEKDEKGIPLQHFYEEHGFETIARTKDSDITMKLVLNRTEELLDESREDLE